MDKAEIEALKAAHPILQVLQALGVQVVNGRFRCPTPQNHSNGDRTPSVSVRADRGTFKCWVCPDMCGDIIDLIRLVRGCSFREALGFLGATPAGPVYQPARPAASALPPTASAHPPASSALPPASTAVQTSVPNTTAHRPESASQTSIFPTSAGPENHRHARHDLRVDGTPAPHPFPATASASAPVLSPASASGPDDRELRESVLAALLELGVPVQGPVARYLQKRRIFKRTWDGQRLRMIDDYAGTGAALEKRFGRAVLERSGFFNAAGHLRYYRHRLLFPYFDLAGKPVYMQARGIEDDVKPKELSMAGPIPMPYNVRLLDGKPGQVYLCEGIIDTLTLIEQGFPAVGVPGAANFKPAWAAYFRGKTVHVAFDPDAPGENGAARAIQLLEADGIEARRLAPPRGLDLNDWFRKG